MKTKRGDDIRDIRPLSVAQRFIALVLLSTLTACATDGFTPREKAELAEYSGDGFVSPIGRGAARGYALSLDAFIASESRSTVYSLNGLPNLGKTVGIGLRIFTVVGDNKLRSISESPSNLGVEADVRFSVSSDSGEVLFEKAGLLSEMTASIGAYESGLPIINLYFPECTISQSQLKNDDALQLEFKYSPRVSESSVIAVLNAHSGGYR